MSGMVRWLPAISIGLCLAGCGWIGLAGPPPDWVTNRQPLLACGVEELGRGEGVNTQARRCLLAAYQSGGEGEFISNMTSIEGDPITRYTRVLSNGTIEVFHDSTRDRYSSGGWDRLECDALVPVEETNTADNYLPPEYVFAEVGCQSVPAG